MRYLFGLSKEEWDEYKHAWKIGLGTWKTTKITSFRFVVFFGLPLLMAVGLLTLYSIFVF